MTKEDQVIVIILLGATRPHTVPPFGAPVRGPFQEEEQEEEVNSLLIFPNESLLLLADPKVVHKLFFCYYPAS